MRTLGIVAAVIFTAVVVGKMLQVFSFEWRQVRENVDSKDLERRTRIKCLICSRRNPNAERNDLQPASRAIFFPETTSVGDDLFFAGWYAVCPEHHVEFMDSGPSENVYKVEKQLEKLRLAGKTESVLDNPESITRNPNLLWEG